jgi:hypothetical protein
MDSQIPRNMSSTIVPLPPARRVVTSNNAEGRSYIAQDGPSPAQLRNEQRPGYCNANIWRTGRDPSFSAPDDILEHRGLLPPAGGTVLRVIDFPPQPKDPEEQRRQHAAVFASMFNDGTHQTDTSQHPGMHVTRTIDYAIVLHGDIVALLDEEETVLKAGDILIQRGTNHAWVNRSDTIARVAFVLIDARD